MTDFGCADDGLVLAFGSTGATGNGIFYEKYRVAAKGMLMEPVRTGSQKSSVLRSQLADFLAEAGITDVTHACDLADLREKACHCKPQLVLLDIYLLDKDFEGLIRDLRQQIPKVKVVLTGPEPEAYCTKHTAAMGAYLYLSEGLQPDEWIKRLASVAAFSQ